jgi:hypothetical protein
MRKLTTILGIIAVAGLVTVGCGGGGKKIAGYEKGSMPPGFTWGGKYFCHAPYEGMQLTQTGSTVVGTFDYQEGRIEGTADGNILVFTWSQESGHSGLTGTTKRISGQGVFQYVVETASTTGAKQHNVYGQWGYDTEMTGGGKWDCYKSKKDVKKVEKTMAVDEEGAIAAAEDTTGEEAEEGETTLKNVGAKPKKKTKPVLEDTGPPDTGDERLDELDDLDI